MNPPLDDTDIRRIVSWSAFCALRALPIWEEVSPGDDRPRSAVEAARAFADSGEGLAELPAFAVAALAAAREIGDPSAAAASRAASAAAGSSASSSTSPAHLLDQVYGAAAHASVALGETGWPDVPEGIRELVRRLPPPPAREDRYGRFITSLDASLRR